MTFSAPALTAASRAFSAASLSATVLSYATFASSDCLLELAITVSYSLWAFSFAASYSLVAFATAAWYSPYLASNASLTLIKFNLAFSSLSFAAVNAFSAAS